MRRRPPLDARPESNRLGVLGRTFPHGRIFLPPPPTRALDARTDARDLSTIFIVFDRVDRSLHGCARDVAILSRRRRRPVARVPRAGIRVTRDDDETTRAKNREGSRATARVPVARENTDASIRNERWTDGDARAFIISSSSSDDKPSSTSKRDEMPSTQSVYVSMSILALTGLVGTGVAIGSGVSMMTMQMADAETQQKTAVAASVKETATRAPARGFAASGN